MVKSDPNESSSSSPPGDSSAVVVAEIRASLFHASTVVRSDNAARDGSCASTTTTDGAMLSSTSTNSPSTSAAAVRSPSGEVAPTTMSATAASCSNDVTEQSIHLMCGRLKYSHVKGEWILHHIPIHFRTNRGGSVDGKDATVTPLLTPVQESSRWIAGFHPVILVDDAVASTIKDEESKLESSVKSRSRDVHLLKRKRSDLDEDSGAASGGENHLNETESNKAMGMPSLSLVQCLLRGAEFVSMMDQAKSVVSGESGNEAVCWSRVHQRKVRLQALLLELTKNDCPLSTISACIASANRYTATLSSLLSCGQWEIRLAKELLPKEVHAAGLDATRHSPKRRQPAKTASSGDINLRDDLEEDLPSQEGAALTIDQFVSCCLSPPWNGGEIDEKATRASKVHLHSVNGKTRQNKTLHAPLAKRAKRHHSGVSDSLQSARSPGTEGRPLKERSNSPSLRSITASIAEEVSSQQKSQQRPKANVQGPSRDSLSSLLITNGVAADQDSKVPSEVISSGKTEAGASTLLEMFDCVPSETMSLGTQQNGVSSPMASTNPSEHKNGAETFPDSKNGSSQCSQRKRSFHWHDDWNSPLLGLGGNLKRSRIFRADEPNDDSEFLPFSLPNAKKADGVAVLSSQDCFKKEVSNTQVTGNEKADQMEYGVATSHIGTSSPLSGIGAIRPDASVGQKSIQHMVTRRKGKRISASLPGSRESEVSDCVSQKDLNSFVNVSSSERQSLSGAKRNGTNRSARRPSQGKIKSFVTGKWQQWEHFEFLRLLRIHKRQWSMIAHFLPTRNATQVKTHAQVLMKKRDGGMDIFEGLDEYERDPAAFGKPPDDHPIWTTGAISNEDSGTTRSIKRHKRPFRYSPPSVVRTSWVKLVHKGHISDYHGYSRKYEHFYPLKGKSVSEVQNEICRTIADRARQVESETDLEVDEEDDAFLKSSLVIGERAKQERSRKKTETKAVTGRCENLDSVPVLFSATREGFSEETCKDESCVICEVASDFDVDEISVIAPVHVKFFDKDDEEVIDEGDEEEEVEGKSRRRKSRTAQIAIQKKASLMVLNEMLNTLQFIDDYNNGFQEVADESSGGEEESEACDEEEPSPKKRKAKKALVIDEESEVDAPPAQGFEPVFKPLTHSRHMAKYAIMRKNNRSFYAVSTDSNMESTTKKIKSVLARSAADIERFFVDKEIVAEEKALARGIRCYTRKANQEKMEKKEFAEKQQQLERKHDYYSSTGKRKRKESPEQTEWNLTGSRSVHFIGKKERSHTEHEACPYGPQCLVCARVLHGEMQYERSAIFNPSFRRVDEDKFIVEREIQEQDRPDAEEADVGRVVGRGSQRESQKIASSLRLSELSHTFDFISDYNDGMIQETKK